MKDPLKPRDKITQKMSHDGLIEVNETKETAERISRREQETDFSKQPEQAAQPLFCVPLGKRFLDHLIRAALQDPFQQVWNIFKMIVKGLPGDAAFIHDVFHRQFFDLLLHQKPLHGLCNQFLCVNCHPDIHLRLLL